MDEQAPLSSIIVEQPESSNMESENKNDTEQLRKLEEVKEVVSKLIEERTNSSRSPEEVAKQQKMERDLFQTFQGTKLFQETTKNMERETKNKELFARLEKAAAKNKSGNNNAHEDGKETKAKIHRVPRMMRDKYEIDYFTPTKIAIGPIHSNNPDTSQFEDLKHMWAAKFLDGLKGEEILEEIEKESVQELFHAEDVSMDNDDLARMLLVDGCAVLQFIHSFVWGDSLEDLGIKEDEASAVHQDLFLLENQIPFRVLKIIMDKKEAKGGEEGEGQKRVQGWTTGKRVLQDKFWSIDRGHDKDTKRLTSMESTLKLFIRMSNVALPQETTFLPGQGDPLKVQDAAHLLDLLRRALVGENSSSSTSVEYWWLMPWKLLVFIFWTLPLYFLRFLIFLTLFLVFVFFWLLYALFKLIATFKLFAGIETLAGIGVFLFVICMLGNSSSPKKSPISRRSFCIVQDLKQAGIKLEPSKSSCLSDVGFSSGFLAVNGCLKLLPLLVNKSTPYKLLNLVAYEMCSYHYKTSETDASKEQKNTSTDRGFAIASYLSFLESIIEDAQDVKDLRAARILRYRLRKDNHLWDDEAVARLIRDISPSLVLGDVFGEDSAELREYCMRRRPVWAAVFREMYLSSPWAFLALIAALIGLILTGISTYYAAFPK